ncbi:hypothetical protein AAMO2058_001059600 [Amorphochlora amoebiformis]
MEEKKRPSAPNFVPAEGFTWCIAAPAPVRHRRSVTMPVHRKSADKSPLSVSDTQIVPGVRGRSTLSPLRARTQPMSAFAFSNEASEPPSPSTRHPGAILGGLGLGRSARSRGRRSGDGKERKSNSQGPSGAMRRRSRTQSCQDSAKDTRRERSASVRRDRSQSNADKFVQVGVLAVEGLDMANNMMVSRTKRFVQINWVGRRAKFGAKRHALALKLAVSAKLGGVRVEIDCANKEELTTRLIARSLLMASGSHPPMLFRIGERLVPASDIKIGVPSYLVEPNSIQKWRKKRWGKAMAKISSMLKFKHNSKKFKTRPSTSPRSAYSIPRSQTPIGTKSPLNLKKSRKKTSPDAPRKLSQFSLNLEGMSRVRGLSVMNVETLRRRFSHLARRSSVPVPPARANGVRRSSSSFQLGNLKNQTIPEGSVKWQVLRLEKSSTDVNDQYAFSASPKGITRLGAVFLVRHGERLDHINPAWRISARNPFDSPLSDNGIQQARETGKRLRKERIHEILASPFLRTLQTAVEIAKQVNARVCLEEGIAEHILYQNFARWKKRNRGQLKNIRVSHMSLEESCKRFPGFIDPTYKSVGKTTFPEEEEDLFQRTNSVVQTVCKRARATCRNICLVSHQDPVEYMAHEIDSNAEDKYVSYCCLTKAVIKGKNHRLVLQHDDTHLSSPEIPRG